MTNDDIPVLDRLRAELVTAVGRESEPSRGRGRARRRWALAGVAVAGVAVLSVAAVVVLGGDGGRPDPGISIDPRTVGTPESPIGGGIGSCVEPFTVENLRNREFAFDGVIRSIVVPDGESDRPTLVTFDVTRWYTGGSGERIELKTYERPGAVTSASLDQEEGVQLEEGQRVLASGEDDFLWSCGFSMLYTPNNAGLFEAAFGE